MIKSKLLCYAVFAITLVAFLGAGVRDEQTKQTKQAPKASKASDKSRGKEGPPPVRMGLEPKAMDILKAACDRLAAARTMKFTAVVSYESPSRLGTPLVYTTKSEVTMQRPDKLRVVTPADGPAQEFYYDGKKITAFSPAENLVAVAEAPPTIDVALQIAHNKAAIYFPFTDVIVADAQKQIVAKLRDDAGQLYAPRPIKG